MDTNNKKKSSAQQFSQPSNKSLVEINSQSLKIINPPEKPYEEQKSACHYNKTESFFNQTISFLNEQEPILENREEEPRNIKTIELAEKMKAIIEKGQSNYQNQDIDHPSSMLQKKGIFELQQKTKGNSSSRLKTIINNRIISQVRISIILKGNVHTIPNINQSCQRIINDIGEKIHKKQSVSQFSWAISMQILAKITKRIRMLFRRQDNKLSLINSFRESIQENNFKEIKSASYFVIAPDGPFKFYWNIFFLMLLVYIIFVYPFEFAFHTTLSFTYHLDYFIQLFLILDIVILLNTGYYKRGIPVLNRKKILFNFFKINGLYELLALTGIIINLYYHSNSSVYISYESFRLLISIKIIYIRDVIHNIQDYLRLSTNSTQIIRILKHAFLLLFFGHIFACLWYLIGITSFEKRGESWLLYEGLINQPIKDQYISAYYWTITAMTTVGFGDIVPKTPEEKFFTILMVLFSSGIFAYSINIIGAILNHFEAETIEIKNKIAALNQYMNNHKIPNSIQTRARNYLKHQMMNSKSKEQEELNLISMLNNDLKNEVFIQMNGSIIGDHPLFQNIFNERLLIEIAICMSERCYLPYELIIDQKNQLDKDLYVIKKGQYEVFLSGSMTSLSTSDKVTFFA